jgi:hypothetical protein
LTDTPHFREKDSDSNCGDHLEHPISIMSNGSVQLLLSVLSEAYHFQQKKRKRVLMPKLPSASPEPEVDNALKPKKNNQKK